MSADTTPAALAQRAADELAVGGYEVAQAVALVAIAGALAGIAGSHVSASSVTPEWCGAESGSGDCRQRYGHRGAHDNGIARWYS